MRSPIPFLLLALVISLGISWWFNPLREAAVGTDPAGQLAALAKADGDLGSALAAADRADPGPLLQWVNRAEPLQRRQLALLLVSMAEKERDIRVIHRQRHRLLPFTVVSTRLTRDDRTMDNKLDNLVAYVLVAGARTPTPDDLTLALTIAKRLWPAAIEAGDHTWMDTVGCVRFVAGDAKGAQEAFAKAIEVATAAKADEALLDLYRRRKAASDRRLTDPTEALPLDWPTP